MKQFFAWSACAAFVTGILAFNISPIDDHTTKEFALLCLWLATWLRLGNDPWKRGD